MINQNINTKIDEMITEPNTSTPVINETEEAIVNSGQSIFTGENELVAGKAKALKDILKRATKESLQPLEQRTIKENGIVVQERAKALREPGIVLPAKRKKDVAPKQLDTPEPIPDTPVPLEIKPKSEQAIQKLSEERNVILEEGAPPVSASPTPLQAEAGVQKSIISTLPFDDASLRSTIQATSESLKGTEISSVTIDSLYKKAIERGIPQSTAAKILEGLSFESKVGDNELSMNMAGLIKLHDDSALYVDDLFKKLETDYENFTDVDLFNLGQQLSYHDALIKTLSGASSDIARAMNVFKRIKDQSPILSGPEFRGMLDGTISKEAMLELGKKYNALPSRAGKNALVKNQKGLLTKLAEGAYYTFQSNMLYDVSTMARNFTGSVVNGAFGIPVDFIATGIGKTRGFFGKDTSNVYEYEDLINGLSGWYNGTLDGFESMVNVFKTGERATFHGDTVNNPLSSAYLADTELEFSLFGKKFKTSPEFTDTYFGKTVDAVGFLQSIPFRGLSGTDELVSTTVARYALHKEASRFARAKIKERTDAGMSIDEAVDATSNEVATFLREQPADIYANVEEARSMVNLTYKFNKYTENSFEKALANQYDKASRLYDIPALKVIVPFAQTITKIFDQSSSYLPVVNLISPQFYKDFNRGGAYRDRAFARLTLGSTIASISGVMAMENLTTGNGPSRKEDRDHLMELGWRPNSVVFKGKLTDEQRKRLEAVTEVSDLKAGLGKNATYFSLQKTGAEPLTQIFTYGADIADSLKFYNGKMDDTIIDDVLIAAAASNANTISNMPLMQSVGEIISIGRGRYDNEGEKVVAIFEKLATQYGKAATLSVPGVSFIGSSASAHVARLIDPEIPSVKPDIMNPSAGERVIENVMNNFTSRIPVMRGEFNQDLDNLGRPRFTKDTYRESYWNYVPNFTVAKGKESEFDLVMASLQHGVSTPSRKMEGVELSSTQYNRFKRLYGQVVRIETVIGDELKSLNLEEAIPARLQQEIIEQEKSGLPPLGIGEKQSIVDGIISEYREAARKRMYGNILEDEFGNLYSEPAETSQYGFEDNQIEFPELTDEIIKTKKFNAVTPR